MNSLNPRTLRSVARLFASAVLMILAACSANPPAPVVEAGQRQVITPPIIVASSSGASPSAARRVEPARQANYTSNPLTHEVQRGETLFSIAYRYDLDYRELAIANDLDPPYTIFVGQELNLDTSRVVVSRGRGSSPASTAGTPVGDSSTARSSGSTSRGGGVLRQPIESARGEPDWRWPLTGDVVRRYGSGGSEGLDISAGLGDPVFAASAGDVVYAGQGIQGAGNLIIIRHNDRYLSAYGHNRRMLVAEGAHVTGGQQIAEVGENAAGQAVLHFEIREEGKAVDPEDFLP